jgi:hydrogenase-4 component H
MRAPKLRELGEAIRAVVTGPYTIRFPKRPSEKQCVGCGACKEVCPARAIELVDDRATRKRTLTLHVDNCIFCGQCELYCITEKGITLTKKYDLATLNRDELREEVEKTLLLCELCGAVIGTEDHVRWLARRLGPSAYTNPTVMLVSQRELGLVDAAPSPSPETPLRADRIKILCPGCRRATTLDL